LSEPKGEGYAPLLKSVRVEGVTINPGDDVLARIGKRWVRRTLAGADDKGRVWMTTTCETTSIYDIPGPFTAAQLRHPDLLTGIIREIDAE